MWFKSKSKKQEMKKNREQFEEQAKRFFDAGLLKRLYTTDEICICNAVNTTYMVFPYFSWDLPEKGEVQFGVRLPAWTIRKILDYGDGYFFALCDELMNRNTFSNRGEFLTDAVFALMEISRKKREIEGLTPDIDLSLDEELLRMNNGRQ